ncbi:hypothetical protein B0H13DRAFT_1922958 [Mycena leptocephala]|nr:hypothetical protein B0H13DRAFT_1922958 [Mycena leptocephala]
MAGANPGTGGNSKGYPGNLESSHVLVVDHERILRTNQGNINGEKALVENEVLGTGECTESDKPELLGQIDTLPRSSPAVTVNYASVTKVWQRNRKPPSPSQSTQVKPGTSLQFLSDGGTCFGGKSTLGRGKQGSSSTDHSPRRICGSIYMEAGRNRSFNLVTVPEPAEQLLSNGQEVPANTMVIFVTQAVLLKAKPERILNSKQCQKRCTEHLEVPNMLRKQFWNPLISERSVSVRSEVQLISNSWRGVKSIHQAYRDESDEVHPARGDERSGHQMGEEHSCVRRLLNRGAGSSFTRFAGTARQASRIPNCGVFIRFNATVARHPSVESRDTLPSHRPVKNTGIERQPESRVFSSGILHEQPSGGEVRLSHGSIIRIEDEVRRMTATNCRQIQDVTAANCRQSSHTAAMSHSTSAAMTVGLPPHCRHIDARLPPNRRQLPPTAAREKECRQIAANCRHGGNGGKISLPASVWLSMCLPHARVNRPYQYIEAINDYDGGRCSGCRTSKLVAQNPSRRSPIPSEEVEINFSRLRTVAAKNNERGGLGSFPGRISSNKIVASVLSNLKLV